MVPAEDCLKTGSSNEPASKVCSGNEQHVANAVEVEQTLVNKSSRCAEKLCRGSTNRPDSSEATGVCDSEGPEDRGGPTSAAQCESRGRASDQETTGSHDPEDRPEVHLNLMSAERRRLRSEAACRIRDPDCQQ